MTDQRSFDRLARAWLELMPDEAPPLAVAAVLQAVKTTPQVRRPLRRLTRRFPSMNRMPVAAATAAALVIALGGGLLIFGRGDDPGVGGPSAPPSTSPSPSPASSVDADLRYTWLGELREVPALPTDRSFLGLREHEASYEGLVSDASSPSPDRLVLTSRVAIAGCEIGDVGTYSVTLSPGGTKLDLAPIDDACSSRQAAISGEWLRSDCLDPENLCLGPLEAGTYPSFFFAPRVMSLDDWAPDWGALRYTVPDGWAATSDWPREYFLEPADWYASSARDITRVTRGIYVASHVIPFDETGGCAPEPKAALTAEGLANWIAGHPGLDPGEPQAVTIGSLSGWMVDATVDGEWAGICAAAPAPVAILFGEAGRTTTDGRTWGAIAGERNRFILIEPADTGVVLIRISAADEQFDALLAQAMPIVESFIFE
jgi:hypothetical protein